MRTLRLTCAALLMLTALDGAAMAQPVIDQDAFVGPIPAGPPVAGRLGVQIGTQPQFTNAIVGQSATAGLSGRLDAIDVQFTTTQTPGAGVGLVLYDGLFSAGGAAVGVAFAPAPGIFNPPAFTRFDLSDFDYFVTSGQLFSFTLAFLNPNPGNGSLSIIIGNFSVATPPAPPPNLFPNQYAGGNGFYATAGTPFQARNFDIGFRTIVDTSALPAVPEPATWALMILGFGAVGGGLRYRRHAMRLAFAA